MIPLGTAMTQTGAAGRLAGGLVDSLGSLGPHALLLGLAVLVFVLGQLISTTATVLVVIPIALSAAADLDVSAKPRPHVGVRRLGGRVPDPIATPANLMVLEPGGYRFGDYWKLGLPLLVLFGLVAVLVVPLFWAF
jgi:di/tricarboxylate transporter